MCDEQMSELRMTVQEMSDVDMNSFMDVTHGTQFIGDKHQIFSYFKISRFVILTECQLHN